MYPPPRRWTVVVADDSDLFVQSLSLFLEHDERFMVVGRASSGAEAIDVAVATGADIVLMDILMPGMDGIEATRRLKQLAPEVTVVAVTGSDRDGAFDAAARDVGATALLLKEDLARHLLPTLRAIVSGRD